MTKVGGSSEIRDSRQAEPQEESLDSFWCRLRRFMTSGKPPFCGNIHINFNCKDNKPRISHTSIEPVGQAAAEAVLDKLTPP